MGRNTVKYLALLTQIGLTMVLAIGLSAFGGYWLDQRLGSSPWFLLLGLIIGAGGGLKAIIELMSEVDSSERNDKKKMDDEQE